MTPAPAFCHGLRQRLRSQQRAKQIQVEGPLQRLTFNVEQVLRVVGRGHGARIVAAGAVDKDVNAAASGQYLLARGVQGLALQHIHGQRQGLAPGSDDGVGCSGGFFNRSAHHGDGRAGGGEPLAHGAA